MKTTVDISEKLLKKAKAAAKSKNTTLKQIIEDSLRLSLGLAQPRKFKLKEASFGDEAASKAFPTLEWEKIREVVYGVAK